jgi:hypothetical protein
MENNQKVLVFTSGYSVSANGICAEALVTEMQNKGAQVFVISFDSEVKDYSSDRVFSVLNKPHNNKKSSNIIGKSINLLKEMILHSRTPRFNKAAVKKAVDIAKRLNEKIDFDRVVSVYFPVEAVIAGGELKKSAPDLKFVVYELDSVADGILGGSKHGGYIIRAYRCLLERIYKCADLIMVHESHKECWLNEHNKHKSKLKITDLPILCEPDYIESAKESSCYQFLYGGTLDETYRSPKKMLESLNELDDFSWSIDFYSKGCESLLENYANPNIHIHGYVSKQELDKAINEADILLSIGNAVSNSLPSKIITYMSYGKPIIHFSLKEKDVCVEYLEKYPLAFVVKKNDSSQQAMSEFIKNVAGKTIDFKDVCSLFPMNLPGYSVEYILGQ